MGPGGGLTLEFQHEEVNTKSFMLQIAVLTLQDVVLKQHSWVYHTTP